ncbi:MAG: TetR/AcrR family transcriptional regulator [Acidimicrobiales bacterium]
MGARNDTRREMIRAGARLFAANGYEATSLLDVVNAAGASRGSIYFHFPEGKDQLAREALVYSGDRVLQRAAEAIQHGTDTAEAIRRTADVLATGLEESDFAMGCPVATVALETANTDEALREVSADFFSNWQSLYVGSLLRDGFDPARARRLATLIVSVIEGGLLLARTTGSAEPLRSACDEAALLLESTKR